MGGLSLRVAGDRSLSAHDLPESVARARTGYRIVAWLFAACVLLQVFMVGMELFEATADPSLHRNFAYLYGWLLPAMLILARMGRLSVGLFLGTIVLLVLYAVQTTLPALSEHVPLLGPVHAVNAMALFGLGVVLAHRAGRTVIGQPNGSNE